MGMFPPFLAFAGMVLFAVVTVTGNFLDGTGGIVDSRIEQAERASDLVGTSISLSVASIDGATVTIDVANTGRTTLRDFAAWDVWAGFHDDANDHHTLRLAFTSGTSPGDGEWAVEGIFIDAVAGIPESIQPGILDPGETVRIVFLTSPAADGLATNSLAVATPNGVHARTSWRDWVEMATAPANVDAGGSLASNGTGIFAFRGDNTTDFWSYDIAGDSWSVLDDAPVAANGGAALAYAEQGGTPYVYAIFGGGSSAFYRYNIGTGTWQVRTSTIFPIEWGGSLTWDGGTFIYSIGGDPLLGLPLAFWRHNVDTNLWAVLPDTPEVVGQGAAIAHTNDAVYFTPGGGSTNFYAYDVAGNSWSALAGTPSAVAAGGSLHAVGNYIYALSGDGAAFWRYKTATDDWIVMTPVPSPVGAGAALTYAANHFHALRGASTSTLYRY